MNLAQLPDVFDWHKPGLYVALSPDGEAIAVTLETTGYSTRATFVRECGLRWSTAFARGYRIVELQAIAQLVDDRQPSST